MKITKAFLKKGFFVFLLLPFYTTCKSDISQPELRENYTLEEYLNFHRALRVTLDQLIACAAGGQSGILTNDAISIFYYPLTGAKEVRYFESKSVNIEPHDFKNYHVKSLSNEPLFNGYLARMPRGEISEDIWALVTYIIEDRLYICDPIRLKFPTKPTQFAPELLHIDRTKPREPSFTWRDGMTAENVIYFQVISDAEDNLISGTYTTNKIFSFYELSNVLINIRDVSPPPTLESNQHYKFTLMGVSEDNWVNLIIESNFVTTH